MPVTLTVDLDDKTGSGLDKLETRLTNVGEAANESAKEFETFAKNASKTEDEVAELEKTITKMARSSGKSEAVVRQLVMEAMNDRKVAAFRKQIQEAASQLDGMGAKSLSTKDRLLEMGKGWITFEFAKKVIGQTIRLIDELAARGSVKFKELKSSITEVGDAFYASFDTPRMQKIAGFFSEWASNAAKGLRDFDDMGMSADDRKKMRDDRRQSVSDRFGAADAEDERARRMEGMTDPDEIRQQMNQTKTVAEQGVNQGMAPAMIDALVQRYQRLQQRLNQVKKQMADDTKDAWEREGEAQKKSIEEQKKTLESYIKWDKGVRWDWNQEKRKVFESYVKWEKGVQWDWNAKRIKDTKDYFKLMADISHDEREDEKKRLKDHIKQIDALYDNEFKQGNKAVADRQKKMTDSAFGRVFGKNQGGGGVGGVSGGQGGASSASPGPAGLNFNPMTMARFPGQGGGFFGMDPFRVFRGGNGFAPTNSGPTPDSMAAMNGIGPGQQFLNQFDPRKVRREAYKELGTRAGGDDAKRRELFRQYKAGELQDVDIEARRRLGSREIERLRKRGVISAEAGDSFRGMIDQESDRQVDAAGEDRLVGEIGNATGSKRRQRSLWRNLNRKSPKKRRAPGGGSAPADDDPEIDAALRELFGFGGDQEGPAGSKTRRRFFGGGEGMGKMKVVGQPGRVSKFGDSGKADQSNDMMTLVQKQTEGNAESKQQTQQLNAIAQGIQTLVQQGQPRGGGQSRGTGNRRRGGRI